MTRRQKSPQWDVIVIGTGLGGSAAGAICALHGLKTLILEKNQRPGGSCSYYYKQGFQLDTGTHLFIRGNSGPFGVCTRRLGMGTPIRFVHTRDTTHLRGMNIDVVLPSSRVGITLVLPRLVRQMRIPPREYPAVYRLFRDILRLTEQDIESLDRLTIRQFIHRYTDNAAVHTVVGFLLGLYFILPTWQASAGESIWNLQKLLRQLRLYYPKGGSVMIPKTFLQGARDHGAEVRYRASVREILVADGCVRGVVLEDGQSITGQAVISTTALQDTVLRLTGPEHFPEPYLEKVKGIQSSMIAVQAKIAVRGQLVTAGSIVGGTPLRFPGGFDNNLVNRAYRQVEKGRVPEFVPVYAPIPTNYDPQLAPDGHQIITACAVAPTLEIELKDAPSVWIARMMQALDEMIPGLQQNTVFCDTWSVQRIASWIGKSSGAAVTTGQTPDQVGIRRPGHRTPVRGLYVAGDCAGPARGVGTELACQSGMDCADLIARDRGDYLL